MRIPFALLGTVALTMVIVGCGSATPGASGTPGATLAPGATATLAPITTPAGATSAPSAAGVTGHECDAVPTFSAGNPNPSFASDATLLAEFPASVDGSPVTDATSYAWINVMCAGGQAAFNAAVAADPAMVGLSFGSFTANVDGEDVDVDAWRQPGGNATTLTQTIAALAAAAQNPITVGQLTTTTISGKSVYTWTDPSDGSKGYAYIAGDTMFTFSDVTDSQASKLVAALP